MPIKIPITAAMLEAGLIALSEFDRRFESDEDAVRRIWEHMCEAAPDETGRDRSKAAP